MSKIQLLTMVSLSSAMYLSHSSKYGRFLNGVSQLEFADSSVTPLAVGHVSLGWSGSGPGTVTFGQGDIASSGSTSSSLSSSSSDVSRFFLLYKQHRKQTNNCRQSLHCAYPNNGRTASAFLPIPLSYDRLFRIAFSKFTRCPNSYPSAKRYCPITSVNRKILLQPLIKQATMTLTSTFLLTNNV